MNTTPDPKTVHSGARYPDTAWGRIRAYLDNATTVLSRVDLGGLLAENVQLKRRLEWPDEQPQDAHPLDPARKTCSVCGHYFLAHRNDVGCTHCECKAGIAAGRKAEQPQNDGDVRAVRAVVDAAGKLPIPQYETMPELASALNALLEQFEDRIKVIDEAESLARLRTRIAADNGNRTPLAEVLKAHGMTEADLEARDAMAAARERVAELAEHAEEER